MFHKQIHFIIYQLIKIMLKIQQKFFLVIVLLVIGCYTASSKYPTAQCGTYAEYIQFYKRAFKSVEERQSKQAVFTANCQKIRVQNSDPSSTYKSGVNQYTDFTEQQFKTHKGLNPTSIRVALNLQTGTPTLPDIKVGAFPSSLDYVSTGVTPSDVYDQGSCGSCWAFASTAMYESLLNFYNLPYTSISQQDILQCCTYYAPGGRVSDCRGGYIFDSLIQLSTVGGVSRSTYPYLAVNYGDNAGSPTNYNMCLQSERIKIGDGTLTYFGDGKTDDEIKQLLVDYGPLMVGVYADSGWMSYLSGIYGGCPANSASLINHAVLLYGYDSSGNWLLKNQWATSWGEGGFMRLSNAANCGISDQIGTIRFLSGTNANPSVNVSNIESHFTTAYVSNVANYGIMLLMVPLISILSLFVI